MIDRMKNLLFGSGGGPGEAASGPSDAHVAAAALLVEAASIDGDFGDDERHAIAGLLAKKFTLEIDKVEALIASAEQAVKGSVDHYGFARQVTDSYDHEGRIGLLEMLWEVVYADGVVHDFEASLVRRLSGLLHVPDREAGEARKRVIERLDIQVQGA